MILSIELPYQTPLHYLNYFRHTPFVTLLESVKQDKDRGRYSYLCIDPVETIQVKNDKNILAKLKKYLEEHQYPMQTNLPPFQGGIAGYLAYDLGYQLEQIVHQQQDDLKIPDVSLGVYDLVISFDHETRQAWLVSNGYPEKNPQRQKLRQRQRAEKILKIIAEPAPEINFSKMTIAESEIFANFESTSYQTAVRKVKEYILAGDIYEANISQRFQAHLPEALTAWEIYCRLQQTNPAPFAAYLQHDNVALISASPERFLRLSQGKVEARPIKGTRPRSQDAEQDQKYQQELLASAKDQAENVMIVDLMRNDLSRVCADHSVQVTQLCGLETFATVHHLVSAIEATLLPEHNAIDLIAATFPGGSITGAPKIRSMEIIAEIEPTQRGAYCGSIGYIGFNGEMDLNITIRTFTYKNNVITWQAGGAIVLDSDPLEEYLETLTKAQALTKALCF